MKKKSKTATFLNRYGKEIIEDGVTSFPTLIKKHFSEVGMSKNEYIFVISILSCKWDERDPYPSLGRIAEELGVHRRTASRYLKALKGKNLVQVKERFSEMEGQLNNSYNFSKLFTAVLEIEKTLKETVKKTVKKKLSKAYPHDRIVTLPLTELSTETEELKSDIYSSSSSKNIDEKIQIPKKQEEVRTGSQSIQEVLINRQELLEKVEKAREKNIASNLPPFVKPTSTVTTKHIIKPKASPRVIALTKELSTFFNDEVHTASNVAQMKNIYYPLSQKGMSEEAFIDFMYGVKGSVHEQSKNIRQSKMGYFFKASKRNLGLLPKYVRPTGE